MAIGWFKRRNAAERDQATPEILQATDFLRSRLLKQAEVEGNPLNDMEIRYLENCHLKGKEWRKLERAFSRQEEPSHFATRMGDILRRGYENELRLNPQARDDYLRAINTLEGYWPEFELWAIAVAAVSFKGKSQAKLAVVGWIVVLALLALGYWLGAHFLQ
jgi:hypothetical protein